MNLGDMMRRLYKILILLLIIVVTSLSIFIIYEKNMTNTYRFLSIGDGLAKGLNPDGIKSYNYNNFVEDYLLSKQKKVLYYNYSDRDISISELNNDLIYLKDDILKEYLQLSDMVILSIGEREIKSDISLKEIENDLNDLIRAIKRYNFNICLLGHYHLNSEYDEKISAMNDIYRRVAKENDIIYINTENITYYLNNDNNIYPTITGYREISKLIIQAIELKNK